jgi:hypothetical protein
MTPCPEAMRVSLLQVCVGEESTIFAIKNGQCVFAVIRPIIQIFSPPALIASGGTGSLFLLKVFFDDSLFN